MALPDIDRAGWARQIGRAAVTSLYDELALAPKPGLVCPGDDGSHRDMDARLLWRSLFSLRHFFLAAARAGAAGSPFEVLRDLGVAAEARMLVATRGVNTHRGAIFSLGLLAAAGGDIVAQGLAPTPFALRDSIRRRWSAAIRAEQVQVHLKATPEFAGPHDIRATSHGVDVARRYGAGGARGEAALGFPSVFALGLPALRTALRRGADRRGALIHALYVLISRVEDSNLLYRGGHAGLRFAQAQAQAFLAGGSVFATGWEQRAAAIRDAMVAQRLSPGGSADLLAATWFAHNLTATA